MDFTPHWSPPFKSAILAAVCQNASRRIPVDSWDCTALLLQARIIFVQRQHIQQLATQIEHLTEVQASSHASHTIMPVIPKPSSYSGNPASCKSFLLQCKMYFDAYPTLTDALKYTIVIELLSGEALQWATASYTHDTKAQPFEAFFHVSAAYLSI